VSQSILCEFPSIGNDWKVAKDLEKRLTLVLKLLIVNTSQFLNVFNLRSIEQLLLIQNSPKIGLLQHTLLDLGEDFVSGQEN